MDAKAGLKLKRGSEIQDREQNWLVPSFLPCDTLTLVAGQVGLGKTTACLSWAASITNGQTPIIGGARNPQNVLMLSNEDSEAHIRRIFSRLGGDLTRLYVEDEDSDLPWSLENVLALEAQIEELKPALVIIDSLTTHKPNKCDLNSHGDIAPPLVSVRKVASRTACSLVIIHHTNKAKTSDPITKISGSTGISATARHVILVARHPDDAMLRIAAIAKSNLVKQGAPGYKFRLDPFAWEGATQIQASDLLQQDNSFARIANSAETFLNDVLADGRKNSAELARHAKEGYGINRRSLQRAADKLGVVKAFEGFGPTRKVYWSIQAPIGDGINDNHMQGVADGAGPTESAMFYAAPSINDSSLKAVTDGDADASEWNLESGE